jgi:hypothetical protein
MAMPGTRDGEAATSRVAKLRGFRLFSISMLPSSATTQEGAGVCAISTLASFRSGGAIGIGTVSGTATAGATVAIRV